MDTCSLSIARNKIFPVKFLRVGAATQRRLDSRANKKLTEVDPTTFLVLEARQPVKLGSDPTTMHFPQVIHFEDGSFDMPTE